VGAQTRAWRNGTVEAEGFPLEQVSDYRAQDDCLVWADVYPPDPAVMRTVADELDLDPHAVEDAVSRHERPKADRYPSYLFVNTYAVELDRDADALRVCEIAAFVLPRTLVTVRQEEWFGPERFTGTWDADPGLLRYGAAALLHGLLDVIVDGHFAAVEALDDEIESLEDLLLADRPAPPDAQRRIFRLRQGLVGLRKVVLPTRELVATLTRRDAHLIDPALEPYYRDLYDHALRASDWSDSLRDMVTTMFETNLSLSNARLNDVVKKLSAWAAIIAVPTAVTGFYGMNVPYPCFGEWWGFVASALVILFLAGGVYVGFRRRGWL
jgi:magnesium transporter